MIRMLTLYLLAITCVPGSPLLADAQEMSKEEFVRQFTSAYESQKQGKSSQAAAAYEKLLPAAEVIYGRNSAVLGSILENMGAVYKTLEQYRKAESCYLRCLDIRESLLGKNDTKVADLLNNLGNLYSNMALFTKGEAAHLRSLAIREKNLGKDHLDVAQSLTNLAYCYASMGQGDKAAPLYLRSLHIREAKQGSDHPEVAKTLNGLAHFYTDSGQFGKAEPLFQRSMAIHEKSLGKDSAEFATRLRDLATVYRNLELYAKAEPLYLRSNDILVARHGKEHPDVADSMLGLASLYFFMGQLGKAESLYDRYLPIVEAHLGKNSPTVATYYNDLGNLTQKLGHIDKAEACYLHSLATYEKTLGHDHPNVAYPLNNLGGLYSDRGQPSKAEAVLKRSLQIWESKLGKDHPKVAFALVNLANVHSRADQFDKAKALRQRNLEIWESKLGAEHPLVILALNNLGWDLACQKDWRQAASLVQQARQRTAKFFADVLPVLSEKEQMHFLRENFEHSFHSALSLSWSSEHAAAGDASTGAVAAGAEWLLNGKAVTHQCLAEQQVLARDAQDPKARQLVADLRQTRARLAALVNRMPRPSLESAYQKEVQDLKAAEQSQAQQLARVVGRPMHASSWVSLDEVRAQLGPKSVFVDIARFRVYDFGKRADVGTRYIAWITPPKGKGDVQLIDLGDAERIDQLVKQARISLIDTAKSVTKVGEINAYKALEISLAALSAKALQPLLPALAKYEEWIICPDGALWLTPWHALPLPRCEFAVEKHLIRHVVSGRDLVLEFKAVRSNSSSLFADPDYDLTPGALASAGPRGAGSPLRGELLRGSIGIGSVSFEFLDKEVLIRDEDDSGKIVDRGTWRHNGNEVKIQTNQAEFQAIIADSELRGLRRKRKVDGSETRDSFRLDWPRADSRTAGAASKSLPRVSRLPGTALEAEAIRPHLFKWLDQEPKLFLEDQASEAMVKSIQNPRVLVLATHGYFLPAQEVDSVGRPSQSTGEENKAKLIDKLGQPIENPLLRCGLLFAGCNKRQEAKPGEDDGILTGLEIVGMDLRGTELVVLSACETGLGDVRSGEGVAGLRQAFQLAGAKGVLASLWQVPDRETALLMNAFYGELTQGKSQAAALREAQLSRIAARRASFGAAHPFFWAAFTLTGRGK